MLKTLNMALSRCPIGFSEEKVAFLYMKKSQLTPKMTKVPNFFIFKRFYAFFSKFSTDFVDWNVYKGHQGTNALSSRLFRKVYFKF